MYINILLLCLSSDIYIILFQSELLHCSHTVHRETAALFLLLHSSTSSAAASSHPRRPRVPLTHRISTITFTSSLFSLITVLSSLFSKPIPPSTSLFSFLLHLLFSCQRSTHLCSLLSRRVDRLDFPFRFCGCDWSSLLAVFKKWIA